MKTVKTIILIILGFCASGQELDRQVISSGGAYLSSTGGPNVHCTIGQTAVSTLQNSQVKLTQGFQQYYLVMIGVDETMAKINLSIYPNPTSDRVNVENLTSEELIYQLYDVSGRAILEKRTRDQETVIEMYDYPTGNYIIQVLSDKGEYLQSYKIQKILF